MESTKQFYDNLIMFYELAPASEHTLALIIKNLKECQKREERLNSKIEANARAEECLLSQFNFARIDAINAGLKKECREKKHHVEFLLKKIHDEQNQIADLEAKLEEREESIKYLKGIKRYDIGEMLTENAELKQQLAELEVKNDKLGTELCNADNIVSYLQQQLAEKEKEIDEVRSNHANLVADIAYKAVNVYTAESKKTGVPTFYKIHYSQLLKIEDMENLRNYAQDKISFAVEQLKCILNIIESIFEKALKQSSINQSFYDEILNCIDTQIEKLKSSKNNDNCIKSQPAQNNQFYEILENLLLEQYVEEDVLTVKQILIIMHEIREEMRSDKNEINI